LYRSAFQVNQAETPDVLLAGLIFLSELLKLHKNVFLTLDVFFVNKIPFLLSLSRKIRFTAVNYLADRTIPDLFKAFKEIYQHYLHRGFRITTVHDGEFSPLKTLIESLPGGPRLNLASSNEHVPEIERRIRVVKERSRAARHSLPFQRVPTIMTIHIVFHAVKLLNFLPPKGGNLDHFKPQNHPVWGDPQQQTSLASPGRRVLPSS
jgi:hypothetical protein